MLEKSIIDICILSARLCQKHLPGRHDQRTHGNRFGHVSGYSGRVQVRVGGGAPGHNVLQRDSEGKPTLVATRTGKKPKKPSANVVATPPPLPHEPIHEATNGAMSHKELLASDVVEGDPGFYATRPRNGDPLLGKLNKAQGFDGKPQIVEDNELDKYIANGEMELWRGTSSRNGQHENAFMTGDFFPGYGIYGMGTYVAHDIPAGTKNQYGNTVQANKLSGKEVAGEYSVSNHTDGVVWRMSLKEGAKLGDYNALLKEAAQKHAKQEKVTADALANIKGKRGKNRAAATAEYEKQNALLYVYKDVGRYATSQGYDGYNMTGTGHSYDERYLVLLNRTAVRVSKTLHYAKQGYSGKPIWQ